MDMLKRKQEELTQQLWGVMGELDMARAKKAGHLPKTMPDAVDQQQSRGRGTIDKTSLSSANSHAYLRNRFGTTSQQSWCVETITGMPQLNNTDRRFRRKVTDVSLNFFLPSCFSFFLLILFQQMICHIISLPITNIGCLFHFADSVFLFAPLPSLPTHVDVDDAIRGGTC